MRPVEACYENGFLKPAQPLKLRQGEKVAVVLRHLDPARRDMKRLAVGSTEDETLASADLDAWADALDAEDGTVHGQRVRRSCSVTDAPIDRGGSTRLQWCTWSVSR
jgi:predicted DNA-binding antitoxin AbrB/MazE fold protein